MYLDVGFTVISPREKRHYQLKGSEGTVEQIPEGESNLQFPVAWKAINRPKKAGLSSL